MSKRDAATNTSDGESTGDEEEEEEESTDEEEPTYGSKIQVYEVLSLNRFRLVDAFAGNSAALRWIQKKEEEDGGAPSEHASVDGLRYAIERNTVYHGYRWTTLDGGKDGKTLPPTATKKQSSSHKLIAMLDESGTTVKDVFGSQAEAAKKVEVSRAAICQAIDKKRAIHTGARFQKWDLVDKKLRKAYLQTGKTLPTIASRPSAKPVEHVMKDGTVVKYPNIQAAVNAIAGCHQSINRWIKRGEVRDDGSKWRWA